jgi:cytochrome c2
MLGRVSIAWLIALLAPIAASAETPSLQDKIDAGKNTVSRLCTQCHAITGPASTGGAPPFSTMAATRDDAYLRRFRHDFPIAFPAVVVFGTNDDIIAYIESLKK